MALLVDGGGSRSATAPSSDGARSGGLLAQFRVQVTHTWRHGRPAQLRRPQLFNELVQHRKLFDRDPRFPLFADKVAVKPIVAATLGREWVTPTLWQGSRLPQRACWPAPFVVKARHGCGQHAFVRSEDVDWSEIRRRAHGWTRERYGIWLDEWLYGQIERGLLVEQFIGEDGALPIDYKIFVFGGRAAFVQVHLSREHHHRWIVLDTDWRPVSRDDDAPPRPRSLPAMLAAAETLSEGFDFVRIDFYEVAGTPRFGEMTFYPGSGLDPFDPIELDATMGRLWLAAGAGVSGKTGAGTGSAGRRRVASYA
ncbi:MAG TPA: ATP-grasp fold amidoligase family protein [Sphingomonas sp.]|jgi:hypothetical protein|nr:ATP-grasp fold amidoligase family protein [Sphingomonas sp.]